MSVSDFITEQEYFNHKRSLINRLVLGTGIVRGLKAEKDEEEASLINVSAGAAIDPCGREIIIPEVQKIPAISIIAPEKETIYENGKLYPFYLRLNYVERGEELAFSLTKADSQCDMAAEQNYIHEGYQFSLVPENMVKSESRLPGWYKSQIIYRDDRVQIERTVPAFVSTGDVFKTYLKLTILNDEKDLLNKWTITQNLAGCTLYEQESRTMITQFSSVHGAGTGIFIAVHDLRADIGAFPGKIQTVKVEVDGVGIETPVPNSESEFSVIEESVAAKTANTLSMEKRPEYSSDCSECECVYLSMVTLKYIDGRIPSFIVEKIDDVPNSLKDIVYNNNMIFNLLCQLEEREEEQRKDLRNELSRINVNKTGEILTGIKVFEDIEIGKDYYSEEINTGFGKAQFVVNLGFEIPDSGEGFFGDSEFFVGSDKYKEKYPNVVMGAVLNSENGSFVIGVRRKNEEPALGKIVIRWWAHKVDKEM